MKTKIYQKLSNLQELNEISDTGIFQHKYIRSILIAKKYFNEELHKKGLYYIKKTENETVLMIAYVKGVFGDDRNYVPAIVIRHEN